MFGKGKSPLIRTYLGGRIQFPSSACILYIAYDDNCGFLALLFRNEVLVDAFQASRLLQGIKDRLVLSWKRKRETTRRSYDEEPVTYWSIAIERLQNLIPTNRKDKRVIDKRRRRTNFMTDEQHEATDEKLVSVREPVNEHSSKPTSYI